MVVVVVVLVVVVLVVCVVVVVVAVEVVVVVVEIVVRLLVVGVGFLVVLLVGLKLGEVFLIIFVDSFCSVLVVVVVIVVEIVDVPEEVFSVVVVVVVGTHFGLGPRPTISTESDFDCSLRRFFAPKVRCNDGQRGMEAKCLRSCFSL